MKLLRYFLASEKNKNIRLNFFFARFISSRPRSMFFCFVAAFAATHPTDITIKFRNFLLAVRVSIQATKKKPFSSSKPRFP